MEEGQEIVVAKVLDNNVGQVAKLDSFTSVQDIQGLAQIMIDSRIIPSALKTPAQVIAVILQGRDLGMGAVTALNNINIIQGRATLSIHAITAKLLQKGIKFQTIKDYEAEKNDAGAVSDYVTSIKFYIPLEKPINGEHYLTDIATFSLREARLMGLTEKDNWKKMPKIMLYTRCLAIGARRVAADAILGMYETSEWADVVGQNYTLVEGEVKVIE